MLYEINPNWDEAVANTGANLRSHIPVLEVADACRTGTVKCNFGLAFELVIVPIFAIAMAIHVSFSLAAMHGIAIAALGMLNAIATELAINAYGPIVDKLTMPVA